MKKISQGVVWFVFFALFILAFAVGSGYANAAGLNFSADTTVVLGANNYTIMAGSTAETITGTGTTTLTVSMLAGESFTLSSPNAFALVTAPTVFPQTCSGGTNSVTLSGAGTFTITPNPAQQCSVGLGHIIVNPPVIPPVQLPLQCAPGTFFNTVTGQCQSLAPRTQVSIPGCASNVGFSILTGQSCANNNVNTGLVPIIGCGNSNVGFSTLTGQSCANNLVLPSVSPAPIAGCGNINTGFSIISGQSCANNPVINPAVPGFPAHTTYNFGNVTLQNGSSGAAVAELQRFLNKFQASGLVTDGLMGPKTVAAVVKWQGAHNLVADGSVGPLTKAQMTIWAATH